MLFLSVGGALRVSVDVADGADLMGFVGLVGLAVLALVSPDLAGFTFRTILVVGFAVLVGLLSSLFCRKGCMVES